ncbi:hypothetical protein [Rickettsiales endosymbiont of Peranema trichophorum]|uniref:hypothetical protein n=1 Tax=Rickettsiales endosymbiont of Peranema trichophorum TaxID=2486577 RepID=UPI0013EE79FC|nr:hypothetical protein [Rickettsiales endosymbiont of Peranema trichophorum]
MSKSGLFFGLERRDEKQTTGYDHHPPSSTERSGTRTIKRDPGGCMVTNKKVNGM